MTDVPVRAYRNELRGVLKRHVRRSGRWSRCLAEEPEERECVHREQQRSDEKKPRDELMQSKWLTKPGFRIQEDEDQDEFEREESEESM